eukprot:CAMPEP_0198313046 /NCGR_PEP_ID=MMETSP1450-20131203/4198_1 /TAXON_ID=753684 ORGANISM="Madagascaria erythrocladiodes, Strain CCMP3234" /NCGR_SAMPLE_ID=MMETSP1450 /ASSEMBLY_ACC=CAM_ASM_001115 /LENGTH=228 /DNA_ID=CAMNT_0044016019 /DNA_START=354 /DNA_END=1040 /DNA_ORIENTATION=-
MESPTAQQALLSVTLLLALTLTDAVPQGSTFGHSEMSDASKRGLLSVHQSRAPLSSILNYAISDAVFEIDSVEDKLLRILNERVEARRSETPLMDFLENEGILRPGTLAHAGIAKVRIASVGMRVNDIALPEVSHESTCEVDMRATCHAIQSACQVASTAIVESEICYCKSLSSECLACSETCGWSFCTTPDYHIMLYKGYDSSCPPAGYSLDLYGSFAGLRGKRMLE